MGFLAFFLSKDFISNKSFEWQNEVNCLSNIQHQNVVTLLGYCIHGETRLLVYEMMEHGSLESHLHGKIFFYSICLMFG